MDKDNAYVAPVHVGRFPNIPTLCNCNHVISTQPILRMLVMVLTKTAFKEQIYLDEN